MAGLFTPLTLKGHTLRNRVVMPPMGTNMATARGEVTDEHIDHYVQRAEAGVAMIIVEHAYVHRDGRVSDQQMGIYDDDLIPGLRRLADAVKGCGTVVGIQITHGGGKCSSDIIGRPPISASDIIVPGVTEKAQGATEDEIGEIITAFATGASRAMEAGFDFVEIHGAHGYLLSQFLSPLTNQRTDKFGGSPVKRQFLPGIVVTVVREAIGSGALLLYRLGANDYTAGGLTLENGKQAAMALDKAGVDLLDISGGLIGASTPDWDGVSQGYFVPMASEIRQVVSIPVVVAGGITDPEYADRIIREGKIELIAIGRTLLENPEWTEEAREYLGSG